MARRLMPRRTIGEQLGFTNAQAKQLMEAGLRLEQHGERDAAAAVLDMAARVLELVPPPPTDAEDPDSVFDWLNQELAAEVEVPVPVWRDWQPDDEPRLPFAAPAGWRDD